MSRAWFISSTPPPSLTGCVNVVCSDKTGTLTENKMEVMQMYSGTHSKYTLGEAWLFIFAVFLASQKLAVVTAEGSLDYGGEASSLLSHPDIQRVVEVGCVCNNAQLREGKLLGHPTEGALLAVSHKVSL